MLHTLIQAVMPAVLARAVLLANHVLASEPVAVQRLRPHAGRVVRVRAEGWPALLPAWPPLAFRLTPAGLLEWAGEAGSAGEAANAADTADTADTADLELAVDASNPALLAWRLAAGERPDVRVSGDAALAADVDWVATHVRWDVAADLERFVGPGPAQALTSLVRALRGALREGRQPEGTP